MLSNCSYAIGWAEVIWLPYSIKCLAGINLDLWALYEMSSTNRWFYRRKIKRVKYSREDLDKLLDIYQIHSTFHREFFVLYSISSYFVCCIEIKLWNKHNCIDVVWCKMHRQLAVGFCIHKMIYDLMQMHWNCLYQYYPWLSSIVS